MKLASTLLENFIIIYLDNIMKRNEKISLVSALFFLFSFLLFVVMAHAKSIMVVTQVAIASENCGQIAKNIKVALNKVRVMQKGMQNTLNSDQPIDKYNRHVNILVGNLEVGSIRLSKLLEAAEQSGCNKLVELMRDHAVNTKNIFLKMMETIQLPTPKKPLLRQNEKLKSELDNLMKAHRKLSSIVKSKT
tara:strand:- start:288 stop:860 length:573 start_codon:yes stop_codon:yes gene_type:complete